MGGENFEVFAILRDSAAGEGNAFFFEALHEGLITQGFARILFFDKGPDTFHDAFLGFSVAILRFNLFRKKAFVGDGTLRGFEVFPVDRAADRGFMEIDTLGDVLKS